jgi:putative oxidoreductase
MFANYPYLLLLSLKNITMNIKHPNFLLRIAVAFILLLHSIPGMFNNGINDFGNLYLNNEGFSPFGVPLAWIIKLSHVVCAVCLVLDKYVKPAAIATIVILVAGIFMVHMKEGWFVVGGGRNGIEFNFLLIVVLIRIMYRD